MQKSISSRQYAHFIHCLRDAREQAGLTQVEMALRLDTTQTFVSRCERGERRIDVMELRAFCQALGIPLGAFIKQLERGLP